jgi:hypothetical protein
MYVSKDECKPRIDWFVANQGPLLRGCLDINKPWLDLTADDFLLMFRTLSNLTDPTTGNPLDALSIYFAVYGSVTDPDTPGGFENRFTYIFSGGIQTGDSDGVPTASDSGFYYNVVPGNGFSSNGSSISEAIMQRWTANWKRFLRNLPVDTANKDNRNKNGEFTDTVSVTYLWKDLVEMVAEIGCQGTAGVRIRLVSYPGGAARFEKRLTTHFILLDGAQQEIDSNPDNCRQSQEMRNALLLDGTGSGLDTGSPCPPAGNCP